MLQEVTDAINAELGCLHYYSRAKYSSWIPQNMGLLEGRHSGGGDTELRVAGILYK